MVLVDLKNVLGININFSEDGNPLPLSDGDLTKIMNMDVDLLRLSTQIDKFTLSIISSGFSMNELNEAKNVFVEVLDALMDKMAQLFAILTSLVKVSTDSSGSLSEAQKEQLNKIYKQVNKTLNTLIFRLAELQSKESLIFYRSLKMFLIIISKLLEMRDHISIELRKSLVISLFYIVNTIVYNNSYSQTPSITNSPGFSGTTPTFKAAGREQNHAGILSSPTKYRNYESQLIEVSSAYSDFFSEETVIGFLNFLISDFLANDFSELWKEDPEKFIDHEDEQFSLWDFELDLDAPLSYLTS